MTSEDSSAPRAVPRSTLLRVVPALAFALLVPTLVEVTTISYLIPRPFVHGMTVLVAVLALLVPWVVIRLRVPETERFVWILASLSAAVAAFSYLTGVANGLTDEPFTTPQYLTLLFHGQNFYAVPLHLTYPQYGTVTHSDTYYVYLPLLSFLQIPLLPYKLLTLGCWAGTVWLVRRDFVASVLLAQPYVALMAANGFNDLTTLLLLTLGFVGVAGRRQKWAEVVSLGLKQFANVLIFAYYGLKREWRKLLISVAITGAFLAPFLAWDFSATVCNAILYQIPSNCPSARGSFSTGMNYGLWPLWILAVFHRPIFEALRKVSVTRRWVDRWGSAKSRSAEPRALKPPT